MHIAPRKRGRPKHKDVPQIKLIDKLMGATRAGGGQPIVYASTTKGGMKLVYKGHHFKFSFRKGLYSVFQCCYRENREECKMRVVCDQKRVYELDGEHGHFVQATDKSVTSEQFVPREDDDACIVESDTATAEDDVLILEDFKILDENASSSTMAPSENVQEISLTDISEDAATSAGANNDGDTEANDFREKIKRRLQKALQGKKK